MRLILWTALKMKKKLLLYLERIQYIVMDVNKMLASNMRTVLITGPEELFLILNRGKGKEFDIKLNFSENLNLYRFIEKKETGYKYKLTGLITHKGESIMSSHFIAFCKD
jgi:hypothetical protein